MAQPAVKAIIFDCFGVLYVDPTSYFYEHQVKDFARLKPELLELTRMYDYSLISGDELNQSVARLTGLPVEVVARGIRGRHVRNDKLLEYINELRPNYRVGMLSNIGAGGMDDFFTADERQQLFDVVVLSGEVGVTKPHPAIYQIAAERLGVSPAQCVMIDDLEENCAGADAAGMAAIRYQDLASLRGELSKLLST